MTISVPELQQAISRHAKSSLGKAWRDLSDYERFVAVALAVRDEMVDRMLATEERYREVDAKRLYYLSIEFLIGQSLDDHLRNLGLRETCSRALENLGADLDRLEDVEPDAALGNGGLGRLAACFLDSLATLGLPGYGYGINYEYGLFRQQIYDGRQREYPDNWLAQGTPWQIARPEEACLVPIYGRIAHEADRSGDYNPMWMDWRILVGVPHDMLVPGYGGHAVHFLRLFSARASRDFDMKIFNDGDYFKAVEQKISSETISKVLYPSDAAIAGQELRLLQEYFLVACATRDIVRRFEQGHDDFRALPAKVAIQLNDTHPALAVAELMRVLVDEKSLAWDEAWTTTRATLAYTNHTLAPEALERWPAPLLEKVLPRHLQIIYEINRRFLADVAAAYPDDGTRAQRLSLIEEGQPPQVRMVNLAIVGSHSVNGVSAIHTELLKSTLVPDFFALTPEKFNNKTNGVTQRRWLLKANSGLADLITSAIGDGWIRDLERLRELEPLAGDSDFQLAFGAVKRANKRRLADVIAETARRTAVDPDSLFDVQVKRIHAYKRQLLNVMHIVHDYLLAAEDGVLPGQPRTYVLAGKAAPGYWLAKQIIKLIHEVARVVNADPRTKGAIKVAFIPDYRVSLAEKIIPAADISEQISAAGMEASGTSNMKLALNGAVTMGTLDGATIEIREAVGRDNIFIFGLKADEVRMLRQRGAYRPRDFYDRDDRVRRVLDALSSSMFCRAEPGLFRWILDVCLDPGDPFCHLADLPAYLDAQAEATRAYQDRRRWARMAILNTARIGRFSSDRTILEYAREIWDLKPL